MFEHLPKIHLSQTPDMSNVANIDIGCIPMVVHMKRRGMCLDIPYLREVGSQFAARSKEIHKQIVSEIGPNRMQDFEMRMGMHKDPVKEEYTAGEVNVNEDPGDLDKDGEESKNKKNKGDTQDDDIVVDGLNLNSSQHVSKVLFEVLGLSTDSLAKTSTGQISTGKSNLTILKDLSPVVKLIIERKELEKLRLTYVEGLIERIVHHPKGSDCPVCGWTHKEPVNKLHPTIGTVMTDTGRCNCTNPNLQNIPARTKEGKAIRAAFIPEPGYRFTTNDYSQIELRVLAGESRDPFMMSIYKRQLDIHLMTTLKMFGYPEGTNPATIEDFDGKRSGAKTINFGIVYGLSAKGLQAALALRGIIKTEKECQDMIDAWFGAYVNVPKLMDFYRKMAKTYGLTWTSFGRTRIIPQVWSKSYVARSSGLRKATNTPIQGTSADMTKIAMRNVHDFYQLQDTSWGAYHNIVIHDEMINELPEDKDLQWSCDITGYIMENVIEGYPVPLVADGKPLAYRWVK